jgi:hypothetical protein
VRQLSTIEESMTRLQRLFVLFLFSAFVDAAWSQETPPAEAKSAEAANDAAPKFSATLLLIRSDWTKSPHAKEIETELREALKDVSVPTELLDKLPASGPEILFGPETVALYSEEHHAELMAWLKAKDLILSQEKFGRAPLLPKKERVASARANAEQIMQHADIDKDGMLAKEEWFKYGGEYYRSADLDKDEKISLEELATHIEQEHKRWTENTIKLSKDDSFIDLPRVGVGNRPFVKSQAELLWRVYWGVAGAIAADDVAFSHQLTVREQVRGQDEPTEGKLVDNAYANVHVKEGRVLAMNAFPVSTESPFRQAARAKGFEAVVMIGRTLDEVSGAPARVHAPDWIDDRASFGHSQKLDWGRSPDPAPRSFGSSGNASKSSGDKLGLGPLMQAMLKEPELTKIIHLKNASAADLRDILQQLAPTDIKLAVDERTNSIIVSGGEEKLAELEAIALRLDEAGSVKGGKLAAHPAGTVAELKQQYAAAEEAAAVLAKDAQPQKDKLRAAVAKAFELRQKLLQAELAEFRQRTERIEQSLQQREGIKQQIIERRVDDLLKPGLEWEETEATPAAPPANGVSTTKPSPEQTARHEAALRMQSLEMQQAEAVLRVAEAELTGAAEANRKNPGAVSGRELARMQAQLDIANLDVEKAHTMLVLLKQFPTADSPDSLPANPAALLKLQELEVKQATLEAEAAQAEYKRLEELARSGAIKDSELTDAKLALNRAQVKLDKVQVRLDVARQIASPDRKGGGGTRD